LYKTGEAAKRRQCQDERNGQCSERCPCKGWIRPTRPKWTRRPDDKNHQELWGELTIKGITKVIKLDVVFGGIRIDPRGNEKAGFAVAGTINRNDWGLSWNTALEAGGILIGEEVIISCEVELVNMGQKGETMELKTEDTGKLRAVK